MMHKYTSWTTIYWAKPYRWVVGQRPENRAPTRRSLKPVLGCLRRNRRRVFAAAVTRYLKAVYGAVVADIGDFPRRQANQDRAMEGDEGAGGMVAGSGAISARDLACSQSHRWQADPARRAACGPNTGTGAAEAPFQHVGTATGATNCPWPGPAREPVSVRELWVSAEISSYQALSADDFR